MEAHIPPQIQIHTAIELYFDENYICAITLSGAAEVVLGDLIKHSLGPSANHVLDEAIELIREKYPDLDKKQIVSMLNLSRDGLKHLKHDFQLKPKKDAAMYICRAIANYGIYRGSFTKEMDEFRKDKSIQEIVGYE